METKSISKYGSRTMRLFLTTEEWNQHQQDYCVNAVAKPTDLNHWRWVTFSSTLKPARVSTCFTFSGAAPQNQQSHLHSLLKIHKHCAAHHSWSIHSCCSTRIHGTCSRTSQHMADHTYCRRPHFHKDAAFWRVRAAQNLLLHPLLFLLFNCHGHGGHLDFELLALHWS